MSNLKKKITNLLTKLRVDENSVVFAKVDTLSKKFVKKISKSRYAKGKALYNLYSSFVKNGGKAKEFSSKKVVPLYTGEIGNSERRYAAHDRRTHAANTR